MTRNAGYNQVMKTAGLGSRLLAPAAGAAIGAGLGYAGHAVPHAFGWRPDHTPIFHHSYYRPQRFYERWGLGYDEGERERGGALIGALGGGAIGGVLGLMPRAFRGSAGDATELLADAVL